MALLYTKNRKAYLKIAGFYDGETTSNTQTTAYKDALRKFTKYATGIPTINYTENIDNALRSEKNRVEAGAVNFTLKEMKCPCQGKYCGGYPAVVSKNLWANIQAIRKKFGLPVLISCGERDKLYNSRLVGSIPNSKHCEGKALDFVIYGLTDTLQGRSKVLTFERTLPNHNYSYCSDGKNYQNMGNACHIDVK